MKNLKDHLVFKGARADEVFNFLEQVRTPHDNKYIYKGAVSEARMYLDLTKKECSLPGGIEGKFILLENNIKFFSKSNKELASGSFHKTEQEAIKVLEAVSRVVE